jgi:tetratricopeptide (TPR) repeat protein
MFLGMTQTTQPSPRQIEHELTELHDKIVALQTKKRPTKEKELLAEAKTALEQKDLKALQSVLEKLHRFRQRSGGTPKALAETLILKTQAAFAAGAVPKAMSFALKAIDLVPNDASYHENYAYYMIQLDHYEDAKKHALIALKLTSRQKKPSLIRMRTLSRLGFLTVWHDNNPIQSIDYRMKYIHFKTKCGLVVHSRDYYVLGYSYEKAEVYPEAALYYQKAVHAFKETADADELKELSSYYAALRRMWAHTKATGQALSFIKKEQANIIKQNRILDDSYRKIVEEHYQETLKLIARNERQKGNTKKALALYENLLSLEEAKNCPEERMLFFLRAQIQYLRKSKILQAIARKNPTKHHNRTLSRWAYLDGKHCIPIVRVSFS